jgi:hypothetical protein
MGEAEREYTYKPKWTGVVLYAAFFGVCAAVLGRKAALNDRALIINGRVELWADGASTFYWVLSTLSAAVAAASAFLVSRSTTAATTASISPSGRTETSWSCQMRGGSWTGYGPIPPAASVGMSRWSFAA